MDVLLRGQSDRAPVRGTARSTAHRPRTVQGAGLEKFSGSQKRETRGGRGFQGSRSVRDVNFGVRMRTRIFRETVAKHRAFAPSSPYSPARTRKCPHWPAPSWTLKSLQVPAVARIGLQSLKFEVARMDPKMPALARTLMDAHEPAMPRSRPHRLTIADIGSSPHSPEGLRRRRPRFASKPSETPLSRVWQKVYQKIGNVLQAILDKNQRLTLINPH
jgi:hypothetical protein